MAKTNTNENSGGCGCGCGCDGLNQQLTGEIEVEISDYGDLLNKPRINDVMLQDNVTLEELGIDEEIQKYTDNKVNKVEGKELSDNNYSDEDKAKVDGIETSIQDALTDYVKNSDMDSTLTDYVKNSDMQNTLTEYAKTSDLTDVVHTADLDSYVQTEDIADVVRTDDLTDYAKNEQLNELQTKHESDLQSLQSAIGDLKNTDGELQNDVEQNGTDITDLQNELQQLKESIWSAVYPVGSIYMSVSETAPDTLFGGVWQKIEGKFLLASDSSHELNSTGGSATASISTNNLPSHNQYIRQNGNTNKVHVGDSSSESKVFNGSKDDADSKFTTMIQSVKSGYSKADNDAFRLIAEELKGDKNVPMNIMPPYLSVNIWKRTE